MKAALAIVFAGTFCACASFSTMKTARAIDPGTSQVSLSGSVVGTTLPNAAGAGTPTQSQFEPQFEVAWRYGIVSGLDLGLKLTSLGGELNSTISLVRTSGFDLALAPAVGVTGYSFCEGCYQNGNGGNNVDVWELYGKFPLLFGIRFGPSRMHEIVVGPEVVPISVVSGIEGSGQGSSQTAVLIGGVLGVSLKLSPWLRIQPEITLLTPVTNFDIPDAPLYNRFGATNALFYQLGLGFAWGNDGFERPRYAPPERYYAPPPPRYAPPPPQYYPPQPQYYPPPQPPQPQYYPPQPPSQPPPPQQPPPQQGQRQDT